MIEFVPDFEFEVLKKTQIRLKFAKMIFSSTLNWIQTAIISFLEWYWQAPLYLMNHCILDTINRSNMQCLKSSKLCIWLSKINAPFRNVHPHPSKKFLEKVPRWCVRNRAGLKPKIKKKPLLYPKSGPFLAGPPQQPKVGSQGPACTTPRVANPALPVPQPRFTDQELQVSYMFHDLDWLYNFRPRGRETVLNGPSQVILSKKRATWWTTWQW